MELTSSNHGLKLILVMERDWMASVHHVRVVLLWRSVPAINGTAVLRSTHSDIVG